MSNRNKYAPLTEWLQQCNQDWIRITFNELNHIVPLPLSVYRDRPSWANCTTHNNTSFQRGWLNAGYRVSNINLQEQWVEFAKDNTGAASNISKTRNARIKKRAIPVTREEEILLTVPDNLLGLDKDEYLMVKLTKENSRIVEACIAVDPVYQSKGQKIMKQYFDAGDYSVTAYYDIINRIATENSTRTSKKSMACLAEYCANPCNGFLERIRKGDQYLVDELLQHLVNNGQRKDKSLASKLCRYLNEWLYDGCAYTINDSVVRAILPYYLAYYKIDKDLWQDKNFEELSYMEFYSIFCAVRNKVKELNNHELDHLIWYAYKNDSIRSEIAKALAKTIL